VWNAFVITSFTTAVLWLQTKEIAIWNAQETPLKTAVLETDSLYTLLERQKYMHLQDLKHPDYQPTGHTLDVSSKGRFRIDA
jgi:hypothetical protein